MKTLSITEYGRIPRSQLSPMLIQRLQRFDEAWSRAMGGSTVFNWGQIAWIGAGSWVGVVQVPGLTVEILPKTDGGEGPGNALHTLLFMLSYTQRVPISERDLAELGTQDLSLMDALVAIFAKRLQTELSRGQVRNYEQRRENLPVLKGKLMVSQHIRQNCVHRERFAVAYDEFTGDTLLNRIIKAAASKLLGAVTHSRVQTQLRTALIQLDAVSDIVPLPHDRHKVFFTRANERFRALFEFARMVLFGQTPMPKQGERETFSLLFAMNDVFEELIGRFMQRHASEIGLKRKHVHLQAVGRRRALVRRSDGRGRFYTKPDILIDHPIDPHAVRSIIDTKWKRLAPEAGAQNKLAIADFYQLYAYGTRYHCPSNILLYPEVAGAKPETYYFDDQPDRKMRVATVDISCDLRKSKDRLIGELRALVTER